MNLTHILNFFSSQKDYMYMHWCGQTLVALIDYTKCICTILQRCTPKMLRQWTAAPKHRDHITVEPLIVDHPRKGHCMLDFSIKDIVQGPKNYSRSL